MGWLGTGAEPSCLIARSLGCAALKVRRCWLPREVCAPAARRRRDLHLPAGERDEISRGIAAGPSARTIVLGLKRSASTISREIGRNGGRTTYRARGTDWTAWQRARRPRTTRLTADPVLCALVRDKLTLDWSREQIAV